MPFHKQRRSRGGGPGDLEAEVLMMRRDTSQEDDGSPESPSAPRERYRDSISSLNPFQFFERKQSARYSPLSEPTPAVQVIPKTPKRRGCCGLSWSQLLALAPIFVLAFFGVVHFARVTWAGEGLFRDGPQDKFLPDWGKPGHEGQYIAHYPTDATRDVVPIPCHSHNDYIRRIPFWEGIHYGCTGTEADVWLKHDELYVGHSTWALTANRTFRSLYVDPLLELLEKQNPHTEFANASGNGVFDEEPYRTLVLLVDFKTAGPETLPVVSAQLSSLREKGYLSHWNGNETIYKPVTVVATGNAPFDLIVANSTYRDIFFDAPLHRLGEDDDGKHGKDPDGGQGSGGTDGTRPTDFNTTSSYYASTSLHQAIGPVVRGKFSESQLKTIRAQIKAAQAQGLKARYWDTPAWPISLRNYVWQTLVEEGVDYLNVDDLRSAATVDWRKRTHEIL